MTNNPDKQFFDLFMLVIALLIGVTFALFLAARYVAGKTQDVYILQDKPYLAQVSANIEPFGTVAVHGDEIADTVQVAKVEPVAEVLSGPQVYNLACLACHGTGVGGAPATGDAALWEPRIAKGYDVLREHLLNGFQGDAGFMPPKGGRVDLSDEEIVGALDYMIEQT